LRRQNIRCGQGELVKKYEDKKKKRGKANQLVDLNKMTLHAGCQRGEDYDMKRMNGRETDKTCSRRDRRGSKKHKKRRRGSDSRQQGSGAKIASQRVRGQAAASQEQV